MCRKASATMKAALSPSSSTATEWNMPSKSYWRPQTRKSQQWAKSLVSPMRPRSSGHSRPSKAWHHGNGCRARSWMWLKNSVHTKGYLIAIQHLQAVMEIHRSHHGWWQKSGESVKIIFSRLTARNPRLSQMSKRELAHILPWRSGFSKKISQICPNPTNHKLYTQVSQVVIDWNCMWKRDFIEFTRFARKEISQIFLKSYKRYLYNLSKFVRFLAVGD